MLIIFFLFLTFIILMKIYQNDIVGYIGERYTAKLIKEKINCPVFTDVYICGSRGVQQIDVIAVTPKGVLVIEKKTYIGLIVGRERDKQWKVFVNHGKQKYYMKNPHHQNYGHIQALCENFPNMKSLCIDLVVFGNNANLGDGIPYATICDANFLWFYNNLPNVLSSQQISEFTSAIQSLQKDKSVNKALHKKKICEMKKR